MDRQDEWRPRKQVLTEADLKALEELLSRSHPKCAMGLTPDEVSTLKRFLTMFDKAAGIVGAIILTAFVTGLLALFTKGFWSALIDGTKHGAK